jgi:hypothetical protein
LIHQPGSLTIGQTRSGVAAMTIERSMLMAVVASF